MTAEMSVIREVPPFGRLVRAHRSLTGLTQRELADFPLSACHQRSARDPARARGERVTELRAADRVELLVPPDLLRGD